MTTDAAGTRTAVARRSVADRLRQPHILTEIVKRGLVLSAKAQAEYLKVLDDLSTELRPMLEASDLIGKLTPDDAATWSAFRGVPIGFVDGGMANVAGLGAAPIAIRVGSYVVVPGEKGDGREHFGFENQLVHDLYDTSGREAIYQSGFEDHSKLMDAARIASEAGGILSLVTPKSICPRCRKAVAKELQRRGSCACGQSWITPEVAVLHGPLVNPVSPYGLTREDRKFPDFTPATAARLLGDELPTRKGKQANFISVYLEQLNRVRQSGAAVYGVVERPGSTSPGSFTTTILAELVRKQQMDEPKSSRFANQIANYQITDSVLFECLLDESEHVQPLAVDRQQVDTQPGKIPRLWEEEIRAYPRPRSTFLKAHREAMPVRIEMLATGRFTERKLINLTFHTCRLLPQYSFPVGLDIVDKHAKVPEWMSRQVDVMLTVQLMRKAMETNNPAAVAMVRRILGSNTRDWLFRPDFRR